MKRILIALIFVAGAVIAAVAGGKTRVWDAPDAVMNKHVSLRQLMKISRVQTYYESHGTPLERKAIVDRVKTEIESVRRDSLPEMEWVVNDCRAGLLTQVKKAFPEIKPDDYQLLVYICCGLSPRTISLLLEESVEVIYKRKSRLKARLKEHVEPQIPHILSIFQGGQKIC